jgi:hypothetical protein
LRAWQPALRQHKIDTDKAKLVLSKIDVPDAAPKNPHKR